MSKFGVLITGPAGAGKTTFCGAMLQHLDATHRSSIYINLDPAADAFPVREPDIDIRDLISLDDAMTELSLGPNGGLIQCFEYLLENLDWLEEKLTTITEEYLIIFDLPGQIELFTHYPVVPQLCAWLQGGELNVRLCAAYLLESAFVGGGDKGKFFAGCLSAMSCMLMLEMPHVNVLSKVDLLKGRMKRRELEKYLDPTGELLEEDETSEKSEMERMGLERFPPAVSNEAFSSSDGAGADGTAGQNDPAEQDNVMRGASFDKLNRAVAKLIDDYSMISFIKLDAQDEDSVGGVLSYIDDLLQWHEAQEPREPRDEEVEME